MNEGLVSSTINREPGRDHFVTPEYAVKPLLKFLPGHAKIWECTDGEGTSGITSLLRKKCFTVVDNTINPMDFLEDEMPSKVMDGIDFIITNPPFNKKDHFIATCKWYCDKYDHLGFALLLPLTALEGVWRGRMWGSLGDKFSMIILNKRTEFTGGGVWFNTSWFCYRLKHPNDAQLQFADIIKTEGL